MSAESTIVQAGKADKGNTGLNIYLLFVVSWFLHLPARLPILGVIRFDLLLVALLTVMALSQRTRREPPVGKTSKLLLVLMAYAVLTIPFVEWPGSVVKIGFPNLIKAVVFYYFTVAFVKTEQDLRRFVTVFVACQVLRVLEPLYMNLTQGYWGSEASMLGGAEFLYRLSGSPYDIVNPNGLAAIVCTALPFLYYMQGLSTKWRWAFVLFTPALLYALMLTGSRSGLLALVIIYLAVVIKSKKRAVLIVFGIILGVVGFASLSPNMQDRYLSTIGLGEKNLETAEERTEGMTGQFKVAMRRPLFGHGLGTSKEANSHFNTTGPYAGMALPAHNLYLELFQEIGLVGMFIFLWLMSVIIVQFVGSQRHRYLNGDTSTFIARFVDAMQVWIVMNMVFSLVSYGLSSYDWYLFGGFSVVVYRIRKRKAYQEPRRNEMERGQNKHLVRS
jgi:O-antigen ligase